MMFPTSSSLSIGATALVLSFSLATQTQASDFDDIAQQWVEACQGEPRVALTSGAIHKDEVRFGLRVLQAGKFDTTLELQKPAEACLSIVASSTIGNPVLVVERPNDFPVFELHSPDVQTYLQSYSSSESLGDHLKKLGVGYRIADDDAEGKAALTDWRLANRVHRIALTQKARSSTRSYASPLKDHCVVINAPNSFADWFDKQTAETQKTASHWVSPTMSWLRQYGDAQEFWHEVGHCTQNKSYLTNREVIASAMQNVENSEIPMEPNLSTTEDMQEASCTAADPEVQPARKTKHGELLSTTGALQAIADKQEAMARSSDASILATMQQEQYADTFALARIRERFELPTPGCTLGASVEEWDRARLLLNLSVPRPEYMTFLVPYLSDVDLEAQRKALADAWDALVEISDDYATQNISSQLRPESASRYFKTPTQAPEPNRQQLWKAWMLNQLTAGRAAPDRS